MTELYAIIGTIERARLMLEAGVPYLQLRFKERPLEPHRSEIGEWARRFPDTRVVINDDLELALSLGVWGVHLGQEDLSRYDAQRVREAPLQVGISTHSDGEIERALSYRPALLGFGPVFPTGTKEVGHAPQGIARLREVVARVPLPVVAIGGIGGENLEEVAATGAAMAAMISYLDRFHEPEELHALMQRLKRD